MSYYGDFGLPYYGMVNSLTNGQQRGAIGLVYPNARINMKNAYITTPVANHNFGKKKGKSLPIGLDRVHTMLPHLYIEYNTFGSPPSGYGMGNAGGSNLWYPAMYIDKIYNPGTCGNGYPGAGMGTYYAVGIANYPNSMYKKVNYGTNKSRKKKK